MNDTVKMNIYLTAPPLSALDTAKVSRLVTESEAACLYLDISGFVEAEVDALEQLRSCADEAECPLVVGGDDALALELATRFGLDGVHLIGGPKQVGWARKTLGKDAIVGYGAGTSRHDAMTAAEAGAEYVSFGPLADLDPDLLTWWSAVIETPLVVEGVTDAKDVEVVRGVVDFVLFSADIWEGTEMPALKAALA